MEATTPGTTSASPEESAVQEALHHLGHAGVEDPAGPPEGLVVDAGEVVVVVLEGPAER